MKQLLFLVLFWVCAQQGYAQKKIYEYTDDEIDSLTSTRIPARNYDVSWGYCEEKENYTRKYARLSLVQDGRYFFQIHTSHGGCNIDVNCWSFGTFSEKDSLIELNDKKRNKTFTLTKDGAHLIPGNDFDFVIPNKLEPDKFVDGIRLYDILFLGCEG